MSLLHSEQRENAFLLLLMGIFSIGLMLFGRCLADFVVSESLVQEGGREMVSLMLAPESQDASMLDTDDKEASLSESAPPSNVDAEELSDMEIGAKDRVTFMLA
ncbi:TPA: hypothetical protein KD864_004909, partial [Vibrio parahaemolyticus]|nr:hypothetical protein [Vibrio parahaemolyticus]